MISAQQRKEIILRKVNEEEYVQVGVLAQMLGVSQATVRSDLSLMEKEGLLHRLHGSAMAKDPIAKERPTDLKKTINAEIKTAIGREALKLMDGCNSVIVAAGSTSYAFAELLSPSSHLEVFTPVIPVASLLSSKPNITVHLLGGIVQHNSLSTRAEYSLDILDRIKCSVLFFGADGLDSQNGITCSTAGEAMLMQHFLGASLKTVLLCDSTKVGKTGLGFICDYSDIDVLVTDSAFPKKEKAALEKAGVEVIIAQIKNNYA